MKNYLFVLLTLFFVISCKKEETSKASSTSNDNNTNTSDNNSQTTSNKSDWYIYEWYYSMKDQNSPIVLPYTGPDYRLKFKDDGTIYLYILSIPSASPAFWGTYTSTTISNGSGGLGTIDYEIISQSATTLKAIGSKPGISYHLTLKK